MNDFSPIYCASFASFDPINGVTVIYTDVDGKAFDGQTLENYFRFTFGNVSTFPILNIDGEQSDERFLFASNNQSNIKTASFEINSENLLIITANAPSQTGIKQYYGLSFFIKKSDVLISSEITELLCTECSIAVAQIRSVIKSENLWSGIVLNASNTMKKIIKSHISSLPQIRNFLANDVMFLSSILSSHMQTQMTTIIEANNDEEAAPLFSFLAHFLLPYQLNLSSPTLLDDPVRGLYLQCVKKHNTLPVDILFTFDRPWTWIRVTDRIVFQSPSISTQASISKEYRATVQMEYGMSETEIANRVAKFRKIYKTDLTKHSAENWTTEFLEKFCRANHLVQPFLCQGFMRSKLEKGILMIELIDHYLNSLDRYFLRKSEAAEITQSLDIKDKDELMAITSIAQLYDQRTFRRMQRAKEVLNKLVSTL